jgi:hypothetical protein
MPFSVERFRNSLRDGGARPNQFQVILGRGTEQIAPFLVTAASLPGQTIGTASVFYRGREVKLAGDRIFSPWTTTILNDSDLTMRTLIEQWMNEIENLQTKQGVLDPSSYFADLTVSQLDKNSQVRKQYILRRAWPTDISEVPLSFDANDQISAFSCTWQYQDMSISEVTGGAFTAGGFGFIGGTGADISSVATTELAGGEAASDFGFEPSAGA